MADNDSKRYYWLKLKKDFFQQHQIKVLKSLPNGRLYALIYLELLAESTSHEGELRYSQLLPYDVVTLAAVIDEDKDNVEKAIETLMNLELVELLDDGTIYMREIQRLIGSETGQTIRKREAKIESGKSVVNFTPEIRDKSKEIRDKSSNNTRFTRPTIEEIRSYCQERNNNVDPEKFWNYYESVGWRIGGKSPVRDWKACVRTWERNETHKSVFEDKEQIYDPSKNRKMSESEIDDLLALRGKR